MNGCTSLKKLKTKSCVKLILSLLFIFSLMIDSLIKQQTAWSQGSSKYQKQKKCVYDLFYKQEIWGRVLTLGSISV
jgi:hypothetical protein